MFGVPDNFRNGLIGDQYIQSYTFWICVFRLAYKHTHHFVVFVTSDKYLMNWIIVTNTTKWWAHHTSIYEELLLTANQALQGMGENTWWGISWYMIIYCTNFICKFMSTNTTSEISVVSSKHDIYINNVYISFFLMNIQKFHSRIV